MDFNVNSPVLFVIAGVIVAAVLAQSVFFLVKAWRRGVEIGMGRDKLKRVAITAGVFTIAPAVAIVISVITLAKDLGVPLPWLRLSVVGSLSYETIAASNAESAMGLTFGQVSSLNASQYVTIASVMTVSIMVGIWLVPLIGKKLQNGIISLENRDKKWGDIFSASMFIGMISAFVGYVFCDFLHGLPRGHERPHPRPGDGGIRPHNVPGGTAGEEDPVALGLRLCPAHQPGTGHGQRHPHHRHGWVLRGGREMKKKLSYMDSVHRDGRIWNLSMMFMMFMYPIAVAVIYNTLPDWRGFVLGLIATAPMYWAVAVVEVLTYVPMLGAGGSYLSFVTGNISNLKLPVALNALEQAGVKASSEEGEIISTIAIAVSSIVTTLIIVLGVILITPLTPVLNAPVLAPAFAQILPALFGGLGVVFISKNWKIAIAPVTLMLILFIFVPALNSSTVGIMVPVGVLFTMGVSRIMYKKGLL